MATQLVLKNTTLNGITDSGDGICYDMTTGTGSSDDNAVTNTVASGTEIQLTKTAGGSTIAWISGRVPAGGVTLTTLTANIAFLESSMNANCGARIRVFRYQPGPTITELGGGPFNDGVEFTTSAAFYNWIANFTDQAFNEDDRLLIRLYLTNVGTMGGGFTCTCNFGGITWASAVTINETVTFKAETTQHLLSGSGIGAGTASGGLNLTIPLSGSGLGDGVASGDLSVIRLLSGSAQGDGVASGGLNLTIPLSGSIQGDGVASGSLTVQGAGVFLDGQALGDGIASGSLNLIIPLSGSIDGIAIVTGGLNLGVLLSGNIDGIGTCDGQLAVSGPPPPPSEEYYGGILQLPVNQYLGYRKF